MVGRIADMGAKRLVIDSFSAMADVHLRVTRGYGIALVYGVKPPTNVYALEMDVSEGYPMPKLTPII